jgi:hypothetical protein
MHAYIPNTSLTEIGVNTAYFVMVVPEEVYKKLVTKLGDLLKGSKRSNTSISYRFNFYRHSEHECVTRGME